MTLPLNELEPGQTGVIQGYASAQPPIRLLELGLLPGTEVEVIRLAPFGDPMDLRIRGYHLSLRKLEAAQILVTRP